MITSTSSSTMSIMGFHDKQSSLALAELGCLFRKEQSTYRYKDVFPPHQKQNNSMFSNWRHNICDWYYEFIDHYKFDREIVGVAINYFDRYISSQTSWVDVCTKEKFQIIAITSLFLAIKLHSTSEDTLIESRSRALARLLYSHADPQEIYEMEMDILQKLDWHLNPSTLHQFALSFCQLHPLGDSRSTATSHLYLYDATRYQVELAIFIPALLATFTSSVIAYAALKNAEEKIAADKPHVLTAYMKQSFEKMMKDPTITVGMDPTAVAQCQLSLKRLCPQLPDLDYFGSDTDTSFISTGYYAQDGASHDASISPLSVVDY